MTTATSVFVTEPGDRSVLELREHDVPEPGPGEVQVEVAAAGVNFIDVYKRQGVYTVPTPFVRRRGRRHRRRGRPWRRGLRDG